MSTAAGLAGTSVLVVGDVMLDEYLWGEVDRISPEAPVPVVRVDRRTCAPGGAGNAAVAVAALGGLALLAGVVGADENADRVRAALRAGAVATDGLLDDPGRITTTKSRLLARGQHVVRTDSEDCRALCPRLAERLIAFALDRIETVDAVLLSDYGKGVVSTLLTRAVIERARQVGRPVVADPSGSSYGKYRGATIVTPSVDELAAAIGRHVRTDDELRDAGTALAATLPGTDVLITRGPGGMRLVRGSGEPLDLSTRARAVFDVTGAGDTVAAVIAMALGRGWNIRAAIELANAAAGVVVGKAGTASVTPSELA